MNGSTAGRRRTGSTPVGSIFTIMFLYGDEAIVILSKSAQKTINKVDKPTAIKLKKAFINMYSEIGFKIPKNITIFTTKSMF